MVGLWLETILYLVTPRYVITQKCLDLQEATSFLWVVFLAAEHTVQSLSLLLWYQKAIIRGCGLFGACWLTLATKSLLQ